MSQPKLLQSTYRAVQYRAVSVSRLARQERQRPICLFSNTSSTKHSAAFTTCSRRHISGSNRQISPKSLTSNPYSRIQSFRQSSPFSTTKFKAEPAIATLNPRNDDDGNPLFIEISPRAIKRLSEITSSSQESQHLRITVTSGGCHGFQYLMSLEPSSKVDEAEDTVFEPPKTDETVPHGGQARVVMDQPSLELLSGSVVDFTTELIGSQFKVNNPRATSNCGCGTSFDINL